MKGKRGGGGGGGGGGLCPHLLPNESSDFMTLPIEILGFSCNIWISQEKLPIYLLIKGIYLNKGIP